jgi:hypothetical protein
MPGRLFSRGDRRRRLLSESEEYGVRLRAEKGMSDQNEKECVGKVAKAKTIEVLCVQSNERPG